MKGRRPCGIHASTDGIERDRVEGGKWLASAAVAPPLDGAAGALPWRMPKVVTRANLTTV